MVRDQLSMYSLKYRYEHVQKNTNQVCLIHLNFIFFRSPFSNNIQNPYQMEYCSRVLDCSVSLRPLTGHNQNLDLSKFTGGCYFSFFFTVIFMVSASLS